MSRRIHASLAVLATVAVVAVASPSAVHAQGQKTAAKAKVYSAPKTTWGQPDIQGLWNNATTTPLQRPNDATGKDVLTDEEVAQRDQDVAEQRNTDRRDENAPALGQSGARGGRGTVADVERAYNEFWWERGKTVANKRTHLLTDPTDGKLPPLSDEGKTRLDAKKAYAAGRGPSDSWDDRRLGERCIIYRGIPPLPTGYNNNYHIVQTPEYVAILQEHINEIRVIPVDGHPHVGRSVRQWLGDSRGRWEGGTLVVETTNFSDTAMIFGYDGPLTDSLKVVERFTRVSDDMIDYTFTVEDPKTWSRAWSGQLPWNKTPGPLFEYACHEGNYGMKHLLSGARAEEKAAAQPRKQPSN